MAKLKFTGVHSVSVFSPKVDDRRAERIILCITVVLKLQLCTRYFILNVHQSHIEMEII